MGTWRLRSILSQPAEVPCSHASLTYSPDGTATAISSSLEPDPGYVIQKEHARYKITVTWMSDSRKPNCQGIPANLVREHGPTERCALSSNSREPLQMFQEPFGEEPFLTCERVD